jgi:hypothetical protein
MSSMSAAMERLKFAARNDGASKVTVHADDLRHLIGLVSPSVDARIAELTAEVALLGELVSSAEGIFQNCDVVSGMCACGEAMDRHSNHHYDHAPRDIAVSSVDSWLEKAHIARNALKDGV